MGRTICSTSSKKISDDYLCQIMKLPSRKRVRVLIATIGSTNSLELLRETIVTYGSKYKSDIMRVTEKKE